MFRKFVSTVGAVSLILGQLTLAQAADSEYYFRYSVVNGKSAQLISNPDGSGTTNPTNPTNPADPTGPSDPDDVNKMITAYYVGGLNIPFAEKLPTKTEWLDNTWSIASGTLPAGISFDPSTMLFSGIPTAIASNQTVKLVGFSAAGVEVGHATAVFSVTRFPSDTQHVALYGHTNKYFYKALQPTGDSGAVNWRMADGVTIPPGLTRDGTVFDGTPTAAGVYPISLIGSNNVGEDVYQFYGAITIEDAPTFPFIADQLRLIDETNRAEFDVANPPINMSVGSLSQVKYYVEVKDFASLPAGLTVTTNPNDRHIKGFVSEAYSQASVRFRAIDSDGVSGYSNYFKIGTLGPTPVCTVDGVNLIGVAGQPFSYGPIPLTSSNGKLSYSVVAGTLPQGMKLSTDGFFTGTPAKKETQNGVKVQIAVTNGENVDKSNVCGFNFKINAFNFVLNTKVSASQIHATNSISGSVALASTSGLLAPWSITLDNQAELPPSFHYDSVAQTFTAIPVTPGDFTPKFTFTNGDGTVAKGGATISVLPDLAIGDVNPAPQIARYETVANLLATVYDSSTVVGQPILGLTGGDLPLGLSFDTTSGIISGGTTVPVSAGPYGPYRFTLTDQSAQPPLSSNEFYINVLDRLPLTGVTTPPVFTVNKTPPTPLTPFAVNEPTLAKNLKLKYVLSRADTPANITFDAATGTMTGKPLVLSSTPGYTVTVTDTDGGSATSEPFAITAAAPDPIPQVFVAPVTRNVSTSAQPVFLTTAKPDLSGIVNKLVGSPANVKYVSTSPDVSALGLKLEATGIVDGNPTQPFDGKVNINYTDEAGRPGVALLPLTILPAPELTINDTNFSIPRLADASFDPIVASPNTGFYGGITWSLAPSSGALPTGMSVVNGQISGNSSVSENIFNNIVIRATDQKSGLHADTTPFTINLVTRVPMSLTLSPNPLIYKIDEAGVLISHDVLNGPTPSGSAAKPLTWSLQSGPSWLSIAANGQLVGKPVTYGSFPFSVNVLDGEGSTASADGSITVTRFGDITLSPGAWASSIKRVGESLSTPLQTAINAVGDVTYSSGGRPSSMSLDSKTGIFTGPINTVGQASWPVAATDIIGRKSEDNLLYVSTLDKLGYSLSTTNYSGQQYVQPFGLVFPTAQRPIGSITYTINGTVPGTLVYHDAKGGYSIKQSDGSLLPTDFASLPNGSLIFDQVSATLAGTPSQSGSFGGLTITASDDHQEKYAFADASKVANNTATSAPFTLTVSAASAMKAVATQNPKGVVVPGGDANFSITAVNNAYGKPVAWQMVGDPLPTGITATADSNGVLQFTGYDDTFTTYHETVTATDVLGRQASLPISIKVFSSTDPIILNVYNIQTKVGLSFSMTQPFSSDVLSTDNSYGTLKFTSDAATYGIGFDTTSGALTGTLSSVQTDTVNISVTDQTNRITSKAIKVDVLPSMTIQVPSKVVLTEATVASSIKPTINYAIGAVSYVKGAGTWPDGLSVNPTTGQISNAKTLLYGDYAGLTISGTDATGDIESSNVFTVTIQQAPRSPVIADISGSKMVFGTVGAASTPFTPTVTDSVQGQPWTKSLTFSLNKPLTVDTGLSFDTLTGRISGTPTSPVIYTDLTITAMDENGNQSSTKPFWFGVAPSGTMTAVAGSYKWRVGKAATSTAPVFSNSYGTLAYTTSNDLKSGGISLNSTTGVLSGTPLAALAKGTTAIPVVLTATDAFGRTGTISYSLYVLNTLSVSVPSITSEMDQIAYTNIDVPTTTNSYGSVSYVVTGLPSGLTYNVTTGSVSGTISSSVANGTQFTATVTATDAYDASTASKSYNFELSTGHVYWRLWDNQTTGNWGWKNAGPTTGANNGIGVYNETTTFQGWGAIRSTFYEGTTDVTSLKVATPLPSYGYNVSDSIWALSGYGDAYQMRKDGTGAWWKVWKFSRAVNITQISWTWSDGNNALYSAILFPHVQWSDDGVNFTDSWSSTIARSSTRPQGTTKKIN